jgi:hypothetical protein
MNHFMPEHRHQVVLVGETIQIDAPENRKGTPVLILYIYLNAAITDPAGAPDAKTKLPEPECTSHKQTQCDSKIYYPYQGNR